MLINTRPLVLIMLAGMSGLLFSAASPAGAAAVPKEIGGALEQIYSSRPDLQKLFRPDDWSAIISPRTQGMADLEDWARAYGWREYPLLLSAFAPPAPGSQLTANGSSVSNTIHLRSDAAFDFFSLTADAVLVTDYVTGELLLARNSRAVRPIASLTKLMTAMVALDLRPRSDVSTIVEKTDDVGGVRLQAAGYRLGLTELLFAALISSANNAAHAIPRACGSTQADFVAAMNKKAAALGLASTVFVDPTGIETGNISNAREISAMARAAFDGYHAIRRATSTTRYDLALAANNIHRLKNTNELLTDEQNGLYVLAGKTGYLDESQWNLVVKLRDAAGRRPTLMVVVLGSDTKSGVFHDAEKAARWAWENYEWTR